MQVTINRTEPTTGGPNRTPREQIEPVFGESDEVELDLAFDASSSEGWPWKSNPTTTTWALQLEAMRQVIALTESLDSQAAAEQATGSDEKGGVYAAGFNHDVIVVGEMAGEVPDAEEDDDGDLNSANIDRKLGAIRVRDENGKLVPLPYGGTAVMPTMRYLDGHYIAEFGDRPVARRPKRARGLWTDGAMTDYEELGRRLIEDHSDKWPEEHWFVAILGEAGDAHDKALRLYQRLAEDHKNLHVYSFEGVTNPAEVAEDMSVAMVATKAA